MIPAIAARIAAVQSSRKTKDTFLSNGKTRKRETSSLSLKRHSRRASSGVDAVAPFASGVVFHDILETPNSDGAKVVADWSLADRSPLCCAQHFQACEVSTTRGLGTRRGLPSGKSNQCLFRIMVKGQAVISVLPLIPSRESKTWL